MKKTIYALVLAILLGSLANTAIANTVALLPIDTSKVIFDPVLQPILPTEEDDSIIFPYQPIIFPEIIIPPDLLKGPTISDITMAANINSLLIEWKTNKPATGKVEYGATSSYTKSLEDKELVTTHAMAIPATPGQINLRISSEDALGKRTETENILVMIPDLSNQEPVKDEAETTESQTSTGDETGSSDEGMDTTEMKPILQINDTSAPSENESAITVTNVALGGISLLLAGILIGVLLKNSKSNNQQS